MVDTNFDQIMDDVVVYALDYGEENRPDPYSRNGGSGSDAFSIVSQKILTELIIDTLRIIVTDIHVSRSFGTYSVDWSNKSYRKVEICQNRTLLVGAEKGLGGEHGHSGIGNSTSATIEPTNGEYRKTGFLDYIAEKLADFKSKHQ